MNITVVCNSRAEEGPLESVLAALPEAVVARYDALGLSPVIAMAQALPYFNVVYAHQKPKLVIVLGDRYETLAASLAAFFLRIPIAHIHGGETTTGAFDDALRHSITQLADLHFVASPIFADKVWTLRGCPSSPHGIHVVGAPGLDGIPQNSAKRDRKTILATFHPETMSPDYGRTLCQAMLEALSQFPGYTFHFTGVNADPGREFINADIEHFIGRYGIFGLSGPKAWTAYNWTHAEYIEQMQHASLVIGNSSAGMIEAPWVGCPTVNIGSRQNGRPQADSVLTCHDANVGDIAFTIKRALKISGNPKPQYVGGAAPKIASICRTFVEGGQ